MSRVPSLGSLFVVGAGLCLSAASPHAPSERFPKGLRRPTFSATTAHDGGPPTVDNCETCHSEAGRQWALSGHADARTHFVFAVSVNRERHQDTCHRCHAPQGTEDGPYRSAEEQGVGCAACHVVGDEVVSRRARTGDFPVRADPAFEDGRLCAGCHQFGFPARSGPDVAGLSGAAQPQQDTYQEWLAWKKERNGKASCIDCHFEDHSFGGKRRYRKLARALEFRFDPTERTLTLRAKDVGHRIPTGDIMRWLEVQVSTSPAFEDEATKRVASFRRTLSFQDWDDGLPPHNGVVQDSRLQPGHTRVMPLPPGRWRVARVVYHLLPEAYERSGALPLGFSARPIVEISVPIAEAPRR